MSRKRHPVWKTLLVLAADLFAIASGLLFAYWIRFHSGLVSMGLEKGHVPVDYLRVLPWACLLWLFALRLENLYRRRLRILDANIVRRIVTGSALAMLFFFTAAFYMRYERGYSRALAPIMFGSVVGSLVLERFALEILYKRLTSNWGLGLTRAAILGGGEIAQRVFEMLRDNPHHGIAPLGIVIDRSRPHEPAGPGIPILGQLDQLETILSQLEVDEVILAQPDLDRARIPGILITCERALASFRIVPDTTEILFSGMVVETVGGIPLLGIRETPLQGWNAALKRLIDFCAAALGLLALAPALGLLAWVVRRQDGGPAFFSQERMGLDGRVFKIYKLRTMRMNAEDDCGPVFADDDDPRCTPLGIFMRRYRIDEFPQLINVLRGEMSLVGPRPERPYFVQQFREDIPRYMSRHKVKSGMTGWAQINGFCGKHGSIAQRLKYDLYYVENWSLWLDVKIIGLTLARAMTEPSPAE